MTDKRQSAISRSIHRALLREPATNNKKRYNIFALLVVFFSIWHVRLVRISAQLFRSLRNDVWNIDEVEYIDSFVCDKKKAEGAGMQPMGDLGFSGSVRKMFLCSSWTLSAYGANETLTDTGRHSLRPRTRSFWSKACPGGLSILSFEKTFSVHIITTCSRIRIRFLFE